eukprot:gene5455-10968_t
MGGGISRAKARLFGSNSDGIINPPKIISEVVHSVNPSDNEIDLVIHSWQDIIDGFSTVSLFEEMKAKKGAAFPYNSTKDWILSLFRKKLFDINETAQSVFHKEFSLTPEKIIEDLLTESLKVIRDPIRIRHVLSDQIKEHHNHGIRADIYDCMGTALFWALNVVMGPSFDERIKRSWSHVYSYLLNIILAIYVEYENLRRQITLSSKSSRSSDSSGKLSYIMRLGSRDSAYQRDYDARMKEVTPAYYVHDVILTEDDIHHARRVWIILMAGTNTDPFIKKKEMDPDFPYSSSLTWFYDCFYGKFFELAPAAKPLFAKVSMVAQGKLIAGLISTMLDSYKATERIKMRIGIVAAQHSKRKIVTEHYCLMGNALLFALGEVVGDPFDELSKIAWIRIYSFLLDIILPVAVDHEVKNKLKPKRPSGSNFGIIKKYFPGDHHATVAQEENIEEGVEEDTDRISSNPASNRQSLVSELDKVNNTTTPHKNDINNGHSYYSALSLKTKFNRQSYKYDTDNTTGLKESSMKSTASNESITQFPSIWTTTREREYKIAYDIRLKEVTPAYYAENVILTEVDIVHAKSVWMLIMAGTNTVPFLKNRAANPDFPYSSSLTWFYDCFYGKFFELAPEAKPLFANVSMVAQGKLIASLISTMLDSYKATERIKMRIGIVAAQHSKRKIVTEHYCLMGNALLFALGEVVGDPFDELSKTAWIRIYSFILGIILPVAVAHEVQDMQKMKKTKKKKIKDTSDDDSNDNDNKKENTFSSIRSFFTKNKTDTNNNTTNTTKYNYKIPSSISEPTISSRQFPPTQNNKSKRIPMDIPVSNLSMVSEFESVKSDICIATESDKKVHMNNNNNNRKGSAGNNATSSSQDDNSISIQKAKPWS